SPSARCSDDKRIINRSYRRDHRPRSPDYCRDGVSALDKCPAGSEACSNQRSQARADKGRGALFFTARFGARICLGPPLSVPSSPQPSYYTATRACAENDGLNVFGCARLVTGIGFLRLPASSTSGVTGVLTYVSKLGGA